MKQSRFYISLYIIIPFIFTGFTIFAAIVSFRLTKYGLMNGLDPARPVFWFILVIAFLAYIAGFALVRIILKPVELFVEKATNFPTFSVPAKARKKDWSVDRIQQFSNVFDQVTSVLSRMDARHFFPSIIGESMAMRSVETIIEKHDSQQIVLVGSSLGGYYAFYLAEKYGLRAVFLNPAIRPYELLRTYLGNNENSHTHDRYELTRQHLDQLHTMDIAKPAYPENYLLLIQTGDEVLDYQQAVKKFDSSQQVIITGGSHGFAGFENVVDGIISFICKC